MAAVWSSYSKLVHWVGVSVCIKPLTGYDPEKYLLPLGRNRRPVFASWLHYYFISSVCFPLLSNILHSPIQLTLWLKSFTDQRQAENIRGGARNIRSCTVSHCLNGVSVLLKIPDHSPPTHFMRDHENPRDGILGCRQSEQEELELGGILSLRLAMNFFNVPRRVASHRGMLKLTAEWCVAHSVLVRTGMW